MKVSVGDTNGKNKIRIYNNFFHRSQEANHIFQENCHPVCVSLFLTLHISYICHFITPTVHRPVITEQLKWIRQTKGLLSTTETSTVHAQREELSISAAAFFYKLLTQRLWSVIEAAIFPRRLTRALPGALQEPITWLWWERAFHFS